MNEFYKKEASKLRYRIMVVRQWREEARTWRIQRLRTNSE